MALKVFVDFDGTITREDVGNTFFKEFGGEKCDEYVAAYKAGDISAKTLFRMEVEAIGLLDETRADEFLRRLHIDESFKNLVEFCRSRGMELCIVSDGLDYYISKMLLQHGIGGVEFFANKLEIVREYGMLRLTINFPFDDAECTRCACCKRNIMLTRSGDDDIMVYVGEGYSDRCPAQYADVVFAKDELQRFCQENNISYFLYGSFNDVVTRLEELLSRKKLKKRREAEMKRKEAFVCE